MVDELTKAEREKYSKMWGFNSYRERSPGMRHIDEALMRLKPKGGESFVDLGCGTGRVSQYLDNAGFDVTAVDIAGNACKEYRGRFVCSCLWELPESLGKFDFGFCADVMEHVPTDRVEATLENIARHVDVTYFQIANFVCHEGDKIGEHLHLTVKPIAWWQSVLSEHFIIHFKKANPKHHVFVCKSRVF